MDRNTMEVSCKELFETFEKLGGSILCDKNKNECFFFAQNISCDMKKDINDDHTELSKLAFHYQNKTNNNFFINTWIGK
jgi:hypothetical protein